MYGAPQFYRAAKAAGIKAIVGAELTVGHRPQAQGPSETSDAVVRSSSKVRSSKFEVRSSSWVLPVLVSSPEGYRNLCRVITRAKLKAPKGESYLELEDFAGFTSGLIALAGRQALRAARHGVGGLIGQLVGVF